MSRLLLLGTGPLLEDPVVVFSGQCLRTWQFTAPLLEAGHEVSLCTIPIPGANAEEEGIATEGSYRGFRYRRFLTNNPDRIRKNLGELIADFRPDGIVGVNGYPAYLAALVAGDVPFWADLNGWTLAEGIVRNAAVQHDRDFPHFWKTEVSTVLRGDYFSTVTERQLFALEGELAVLGRLDRFAAGRSLGCVVPNAIYPDYEKLERRNSLPTWLVEQFPSARRLLLWSGGFNSWTDIPVLLDALALVLNLHPDLLFVSTGGAILGHDEETYRRFLELANEKLPAGRWSALGWVPMERVLELHACASAGVSLDGDNLETRYGARNRLTNMLAAGMPVATTRGTEIAAWIEAGGYGAVCELGSCEAFAGAIERALGIDGAKGHDAVRRAFSPAETLGPFLRWCRQPMRAPSAPDGPEGLRRLLAAEAAKPLPFAPAMGTVPPNVHGGFLRRLLRRLRQLARG